GDEGGPADVGVAVLFREAEPFGEVFADDVAVEDLQPRVALPQVPLEQPRDRRLPGTGEPGEPEGEALLASHAFFSPPCKRRSGCRRPRCARTPAAAFRRCRASLAPSCP